MGASKEIEDLLLVAHFTPTEQNRFLSKIVSALSKRGITLDVLNPHQL